MVSEYISSMRKDILEIDTKRDAGLTTPIEVERLDGISYGEDNTWQVLDVYRPKEYSGKLPVIVSVHGGGWVYGNKDNYQFYCMDLAKRGFAVVNFTYRLAPEFKYPAQIEDTSAAFSWMYAHANQYDFDLDRVYAVGDSAGGHLLSVYCVACTSQEYQQLLGVKITGKLPRAVALNCGVYHMDFVDGDEEDLKLMKEVLRDKDSELEQKQFNPLPYMTVDFPKAYVMVANDDHRVKAIQAEMITKRFKELGLDYEKKVYGSDNNKLDHVFHLQIRTKDAVICNDEECEFFLKN